jgi:hypothetical protein
VGYDRNGLEVIGGYVLVELLDHGTEDRAGCIGTGGLACETGDLDEVKAVVCSEKLRLGSVDVAGTGEAWDEEDAGAFAGGDAFDDEGETGGRGGGCLAEERSLQQQDAGKEQEKGDEAESFGGCGHRGSFVI